MFAGMSLRFLSVSFMHLSCYHLTVATNQFLESFSNLNSFYLFNFLSLAASFAHSVFAIASSQLVLLLSCLLKQPLSITLLIFYPMTFSVFQKLKHNYSVNFPIVQQLVQIKISCLHHYISCILSVKSTTGKLLSNNQNLEAISNYHNLSK